MPHAPAPITSTPPVPGQPYDATAEGQVTTAGQSRPGSAFDATPAGDGPAGRWQKTIDGGAAGPNGEPTGAGWAPDGTSDSSRWKGV